VPPLIVPVGEAISVTVEARDEYGSHRPLQSPRDQDRRAMQTVAAIAVL
jgi:hypothetical protein